MTPSIINHLWQSTIVAMGAALVALALRRNHASTRHAVWLAASLKFLLPFSFLIALGAAFSWRSAPAPASVAPTIAETVQAIAEPFADSSTTPLRAVVAQTPATIPWGTVFTPVWLFGVAVVVALRTRGWLRVRAALRASTPIALSGVDDGIDVRATPGLLEPGVVGIWHPVLLVPVGVESTLSADQLRTVVAHELHHIRRRDNLTSAIHMVVEAVFWFHPIVWWIGTRLIDERERACDEYVVESGAAPDAYAEAILHVCKRYVEQPVACVSGVTGSDLKKRLGAILAGRVGLGLSSTRKIVLALAAAIALVVPVAAGMITAPLRTSSQASGPVPKFEAVSIRPCDTTPAPAAPGTGRGGGAAGGSPGRLNLGCRTLLDLIDLAYGIYANGRVNSRMERAILPGLNPMTNRDHYPLPSGLPDWISHDRFTIEAKAEGEPPPVPVLLGSMLQRMLEDRFKLKVHLETRVVPVYELVVAKGGSKVTPVKPGGCIPYDYNVSPQPTPPPGQHRCDNHNDRDANGDFVYTMESITVGEFFGGWGLLGRPVVDRTGITEPVSFRFVQNGQASNPDDAVAERIAAMRSQLGLELQSGKAPLDFLVIDHAERPTGDSTPSASTPPPVPPQKFDVASIRPCESTPSVAGGRSGGVGPVFSPGLFVYNCGTLEQLINGAYVMNGDALLNDEGRAGGRDRLRDDKTFPQRIRGGPDWMRTDRFMIEAKSSISTGNTGREAVPERAVMMGPMLRALLEDRFKLKLHRDVQHDVPMYALTVAKSGLKIKPAGPDSCAPSDPNRTEPYKMDEEIQTVRKGGKPICGHGIMGGPVGPNNALVLNQQTKSLGLELQPVKGPKGFIVVDHAERPSMAQPAIASMRARGSGR